MPQQPPQPGGGGIQQPPQGGAGAATQHRPMMGSAMQGMSAVRAALELLQKALPGLPMGSELHTAVLKSVTDLTRRMTGPPDQAANVQQMSAAARDGQQNPMADALQRMPGGAGGPPPPPNTGQ